MPRTPSPGKRLEKKVSAKRDRTSDVKRKRSVKSGKPESVRNKPTAIEKIFTVLHKAVEIDFSHYRLSTIQRQLQRRIARSGEMDIDRYTALIEKDPREALFLAQELLLPVTEFFRHPATFTVLNKKVFPVLAEHMTGRTPLRIWVPGCSTGEEVYSLAIALNEYCDLNQLNMNAQFFGTDIVEKNIETARAAVYRDKIRKQVSTGRLKRFFEKTPSGFRVIKHLRDKCVFACHDITADPPFPNIDLLSCRNVLIYFDQFYQDVAMPMFHFSLRPGGFLLLGPSESLGYFEPYFSGIDKKARLFSRPENGPKPSYRFGLARNLIRSKNSAVSLAPNHCRPVSGRSGLHEAINRTLCERYVPPGVLIDGSLQVREIFGNIGRYLQVPQGEATHKLTRLAREGLMAAVYVAVKEAGDLRAAVRKENVTFRTNGSLQSVNIAVVPFEEVSQKEPQFIVLFEEPSVPPAPPPSTSGTGRVKKTTDETHLLRRELEETKRHLQAMVEEKEEINQELWAGNEEIQAVNEELQSMNEELEGAKEELESANEEMSVMNLELQKNNAELSSVSERLHLSLQASKAGTWDWNIPDNKFVCSEEFYPLFGIDPAAKPEFDLWRRVVYPEDRATAEQRIMEAIRERTELVNEYRIVLPDKSVRWIRATGQPFYEGVKPVRMIGLCIDITDIKRTEAALRESEENYRLIFQGTSELIFAIGPDGRFRFVNDAYTRALRRPSGEIIGKTVREIFPADQAEMRSAALRRVMASGKKEYMEFKFVNSSGNADYSQSMLEPIYDAQGNLLWILGFARDVTELKTAEETLRESENKFRSVIETSQEWIWSIDLAARHTYSNPAIEKILGYPPSEFIGKDALRFMAEEDVRKVREMFPHQIRSKTGWTGLVLRWKHKNGTCRYLESNATPILEANGEITGFWGADRDITDRIRAEESLRQHALELRTLTDNLPGVVTRCDLRKRLTFINKSATVLRGKTPAEYIGKSLSDLGFSTEFTSRMDANLQKVIDTLQPLQLLYTIPTPAGMRYLDTFTIPEFDGNGDLCSILTIGQDITERKTMEETLQNAQKLESLGLLAGGIAHDFNNLMAGIFGFIDLAMTAPDREQASSYLSHAVSTIDRARALSSQLLTFAKGGAPVQKTGPLFPFVKETALFALSGSNVSCSFDVPGDLRPCNFDKNQIGQVIDNLVINAQQAMPLGGTIELTARNITLRENDHPALVPGNYVKLLVKDCGIGIPPDLIPRIFDPFFTTKAQGHGLGLATCYSIVKRHGGYIDVQSVTGAGSTFHVYLPSGDNPVTRSEESSQTRHRGSGTILLMDDEAAVRDAIRGMLTSFGYTVVCTGNGKEALDLFTAETGAGRPIKGAILDLTVPGGMGGREAVEEIRKRDTALPVFVTSGYSEDHIMKDPVGYGFTDSICKPFTSADLSKLLNRHLSK